MSAIFPDKHKTLFSLRSGRDFESAWIVPDSLSLDKIYSVLFLACDTFVRVELEYHGILSIPYGRDTVSLFQYEMSLNGGACFQHEVSLTPS